MRRKPLGEKDLDALMTVYSQHDRDQDLTKEDTRKIWKGVFVQYDWISTQDSFSRVVAMPGKHPTVQITCTGALRATSDRTDQRVNLSTWAGISMT